MVVEGGDRWWSSGSRSRLWWWWLRAGIAGGCGGESEMPFLIGRNVERESS